MVMSLLEDKTKATKEFIYGDQNFSSCINNKN